MKLTLLATACMTMLFGTVAMASSHREAPNITRTPKLDGTDFYMFRSYENARGNFVTFIANYQPLQGPGDGPNYYLMDPRAIYEIHIDNDGDAVADKTFRFQFMNHFRNKQISVNGTLVSVPLSNIGPPIASS